MQNNDTSDKQTSGLDSVTQRLLKEGMKSEKDELSVFKAKLETAITSQIEAQKTSNKSMAKKTMEEFKMLSKAIQSSSTLAVEKQSELLGVINDSMEAAGKNSVATGKILTDFTSDLTDTISSKIPGKDAIISALGASNPIIGASLGLFKKINSYRQSSEQSANQERLERIAALNEQKELLTKNMEAAQDESTGELSSEGGVPGQLDTIISYTGEMVRLMGGNVDELRRQTEIQKDAQKEAERAKLEALENAQESGTGSAMIGGIVGDEKKEESGFLDSMFGGSMAGSMIGSILGSFAAWIGPIVGSIGMFLKVAGKATLILAVVDAIYEFVTGFLDAADILGKAKVDLMDRISAGIANVIGSFVGMFEWVANFMGFQTNDWKGRVTKYLANFFTDYIHAIVEGVVGAFSAIGDFIGGIGPAINDAIDSFTEGFNKVIETIKNFQFSDLLPDFLKPSEDGETVNKNRDESTKKPAWGGMSDFHPVQTVPKPTEIKQFKEENKDIEDKKRVQETSEILNQTNVVNTTNNTNNNTTVANSDILAFNPEQTNYSYGRQFVYKF